MKFNESEKLRIKAEKVLLRNKVTTKYRKVYIKGVKVGIKPKG